MSYLDRLRDWTYTAPDGQSFTLNFSDLDRSSGKKAPVTEFPNQDQGAVQDLGATTRRYPINGWISGDDYDLTADAFFEALHQRGPGVLDHPRWGIIPVLPTSVRQSEQFVRGLGRATFEIEFVQADDVTLEYPRTAGSTEQATDAAVEAAATGVTDSLGDTSVDAPGEKAGLKTQVLNGLDSVTEAFNGITGLTDDVRAEITAVVDEITRTIDDLVAAPANLMIALLRLYRLPADVATDTTAKIDGYRELLGTLKTAAVATTNRYGELFGLIGGADLQAVAVAAAESTTSGTTQTRVDAIDAVDALAGLRDELFSGLDELGVSDYESARLTRLALTEAIRNLLDRALNLPAERVHVTDGDVSPIVLAFRLYGESERVQEFAERIIDYNNLSDNEILLIPAGTEVRWYV